LFDASAVLFGKRDFMIKLLTISSLRAFHAVARNASLTAAAAGLSRSQPALTLALTKLEDQVGGRLLERGRSGAQLTTAGEILHGRVNRLFRLLDLALQEVAPVSRSLRTQWLDRITDAQLRLMAAVADSTDIEGAARTMEITPASLRRTARSLEEALNQPLFVARPNRMVPTDECAEMARKIKLGLQEIASAIEDIANERGQVEARIAVGMVPLCATAVLTSSINDFLDVFPSAQVKIAHGAYLPLLQDLRFGRIDILFGVLRSPGWAGDIVEEPLFYDGYAIAARRGHPLTRKRSPDLDDLLQFEWIAPPQGTPRRESTERIFAQSPVKPRVAIETSSLNMLRALLSASDRISLMTMRELQQETGPGGRLTCLAVDPEVRRGHDGIAMRSDWVPTRVQNRFIEILRGNCNVA
jgi:LysR family transcriptional regulator of gallate degradation